MTQQRQVAVIVGSLREGSFNRKVVHALEALAPDHLVFEEIGIGGLPLYNQDLDGDPPAEWIAFRDAIRPKDALLFATPEYNRSIPGVLKNAIDVGSRPYGRSVWAKKPGAVISASIGTYGGFGANHHLRQSCVFLDVPLMPQPEAYLSGVNEEHFGADGAVADERMKKLLVRFMAAYADWVEKLLRGPGELAEDAKT
jgi:chromate reductase